MVWARIGMLVAAVGCGDNFSGFLVVNGEEVAPYGVAACCRIGPDNGDGTRNVAWDFRFTAEDNDFASGCGPHGTGRLTIYTSQLVPASSPVELVGCALPVGDFAIVDEIAFPVTTRAIATFTYEDVTGGGNYQLTMPTGAGEITAVAPCSANPDGTIDGLFHAHAIGALSRPLGIAARIDAFACAGPR
ncbi:MAG: hypothetical protein ACM31C_08545 [Acidobacteriota bacterium]